MRSVFLSYSFNDVDRPLATDVERLIRSHGLIATTGRNLAGKALSDEITHLIDKSDGVIALCTQRAVAPDGVTHPWVLQEYAIGRAASLRDPAKQTIAIWQVGVPVVGIDLGYEHVDHDPADSTKTLLRLSEILGNWKQRAGRFIKVQLMPEDVARRIGQAASQVQCQFRWQADGKEEEWKAVDVRREQGGIFGYLRVPDDAEMIQIRASGPNLGFESPYTPLRMFVQMDQV